MNSCYPVYEAEFLGPTQEYGGVFLIHGRTYLVSLSPHPQMLICQKFYLDAVQENKSDLYAYAIIGYRKLLKNVQTECPYTVRGFFDNWRLLSDIPISGETDKSMRARIEEGLIWRKRLTPGRESSRLAIESRTSSPTR